MTTESFSPRTQALVSRYIRSVGHLDTLILLAKFPERTWTAEEVSRELRTNEAYAQQQLDDLSELISSDASTPKSYRFAPKDKSALEVVADLVEIVRLRPHAIISHIYSQPMDKIRSFADAFKIKKD